MPFDIRCMCLFCLYVPAILRSVSASRPVHYNIGTQGNWLTSEEIRKARARWKAAMLMTTGDADVVLTNDDGSGGMVPTHKGNTLLTGSVSRLDKATCCRLGSMSATLGKPCDSRYYSNQRRQKLKRYSSYPYKLRLKLLQDRYGKNYKHNIMDKYEKCALRRQSHFQKCCKAEYYHKKRRQVILRHRNLRMCARYQNPCYKRKRRRH